MGMVIDAEVLHALLKAAEERIVELEHMNRVALEAIEELEGRLFA